jgi:hypothetical protein
MNLRPLLFFAIALISVACSRVVAQAPATQDVAPDHFGANAQGTVVATQLSMIRFDDASEEAGIHFTHSFGSRQLGSLLEGTGAGCVWFDYNNSGLPSLYVVNGRPLDDSMHPYPLKEKPKPAAAQPPLSQ